MKKRTIWISGLVPSEGADIYHGVRLAISDTEAEAYQDLAEWLDESGQWGELANTSIDVVRDALNESIPQLITAWNVESREI